MANKLTSSVSILDPPAPLSLKRSTLSGGLLLVNGVNLCLKAELARIDFAPTSKSAVISLN